MTRRKYLAIILICFVQLAIGQTDVKIKVLFYNLPVDSSRKVICQNLRSDNRFINKTKASASEDTYVGLCNDRGLIKSKSDSIRIELTSGKGVNHEDNSIIKTRILKSNYYFTSLDTAKLEYNKLVAYVKPMAKDSISDNFADEDGSGEGMYYNFNSIQGKIDEIDIYLVYCADGNYGLFISYTRSEE